MSGRTQTIWILAGLTVFILLLWALSAILFPFVAGLAFAYLLDPAADWMESKKIPRWLAATILTVLTVLAVIGSVLILVPLLYEQLLGFIDRLPGYIEVLRENAMSVLATIQEQLSEEEAKALREKIKSLAGPDALKWLAGFAKGLLGGGVALVNILSLLVITPIVMFYLVRDWDRIVESLNGLLPYKHAETIREQVKKIDQVLAGFMRGQLTVCLILGLFYAIALSIAGLEFALIIGLATGLISFIPYFGMLIGFAVGMGVAIAQFDSWQPIAIVAAIFFVGQFLEGNFITPKLVGSQVGLHPAWILFALLAGGTLFGFTGILLAVPAAAVIGVLGRFAVERYKASTAYTGPDPGAG